MTDLQKINLDSYRDRIVINIFTYQKLQLSMPIEDWYIWC